MASRKSRTRAHRRDRRKAKASNWRRGTKGKLGVVSHGATGNDHISPSKPSKHKKKRGEKKPSRKLPNVTVTVEMHSLNSATIALLQAIAEKFRSMTQFDQ